MERVDLYRDEFVRTGETCARSERKPEGTSMLVAFACIFNAEGKLLIQKRADCKKQRPGLWDVTAGGAVKAGETSRNAAQRETAEEIGLFLPPEQFVKLLSVYYDGMITDIYTAAAEADPETLTLQKEEVSAVRFASEEEICAMLKDGQFVAMHEEIIRLLFRMKTTKGILIL